MNVRVYPGYASGNIQTPPSKSLLHRAIISASLAKGVSIVKNVVYSEDIKATINAFKKLGIRIIKQENQLEVHGNSNLAFFGNERIDCNESGSTIRFLIPLIVNSKGIYITGKSSLMSRPFTVYETLFTENGLVFDKSDKDIFLKGDLMAGDYIIPGNISSQFISGLLFALPLKKSSSNLTVLGSFESKKYVDMTVETLALFGIKIIETEKGYYIPGNQKYTPANISIESDFSQIAFFAVAGIINGDILVKNVNNDSSQPDIAIIDVIKDMGGKIKKTKNAIHFKKSETIGKTIDLSQNPDIGPILSILASLSRETTQIINASRLRIKETDRLSASCDILKKFGVHVESNNDSMIITGQETLNGNTFHSYNDHRMVMSIAIAALRANQPVVIKKAEAINKSYPHFFEDLQSLGIKVEFF
jgi:3-phosphoshikimate 1-carboxyvinyltransferase